MGSKNKQSPKFEVDQKAQANARAVRTALEYCGLHGFALEIAMAQAAIESAGFRSPVSQDDNNYSGITWDGRYSYLSKYPKGRARGVGETGNYVHFPTINDWARVYVGNIGRGVFLSGNRGLHGRPIDAKDIPAFVDRLAANTYFTSSKTDYLRNEIDWDKRLIAKGIVSRAAGIDTASQNATYNSILNTPLAGTGRQRQGAGKSRPVCSKKKAPAPAVQPFVYIIKPSTGPVPVHFDASYLQWAAKAANNLVPGPGIAKELADMANKATPFTKAGNATPHPSANPEYGTVFTTPGYVPYSKNDERKNTAPPPIPLAAKRHKALSRGPSLSQLQRSISQQQDNIMTLRSGNTTGPWDNVLKDKSVTTPGKPWLNLPIAPLLKNTGTKVDTSKPKKVNGADTQRHSSAVTPGDDRQIIINMNAPMYQVQQQVFQDHKDSIRDFEPMVRKALMHILDNAQGAM